MKANIGATAEKHEIPLSEGETLYHVESQVRTFRHHVQDLAVYGLFLCFSIAAIYWWIPGHYNADPPTPLWAALIAAFASINLLYKVGRRPIRLILTSAGIRIPRAGLKTRLIKYENVSAHYYMPHKAKAQNGGRRRWLGMFVILTREDRVSKSARTNQCKFFRVGPIDDLRLLRDKIEAIMGKHDKTQLPEDACHDFSINEASLKKIQRHRQFLAFTIAIAVVLMTGLLIFALLIITTINLFTFLVKIASVFQEMLDCLLAAIIIAIPVLLVLLPGIIRAWITRAFLSRYRALEGSVITIGRRGITLRGPRINQDIALTRDVFIEPIQSTRLVLSTNPAWIDAIILRNGRTGVSTLVGPMVDFTSFHANLARVYLRVLEQESGPPASSPPSTITTGASASGIKHTITRTVLADNKRTVQRRVKRSVQSRLLLFLVIQAFVIIPSSLVLTFNPPHTEPPNAPTSPIDTTVTIWSFNIRRDDEMDPVNSWHNRKTDFYEYIHVHDPDIIGFQEVYINQLLDMGNNLDEYRSIGLPPYGILVGEFVPIYYKYQRFKVLDHGTFWLSDTPHWPSSWGRALRIVTWGRFLEVTSKDQFVVFNTHWDASCQESSGCDWHLKSALLMLNMLPIYAGGLPAIVIGDFNEKLWNSGLKMLQNNSIMNFTGLWDASNTGQPDNLYTTNSWDPNHKTHASPDSQRIDHILFNNKAWPTDLAPANCIIYQDLWNGRLMSDHWAIGGNLTF